MLRRRWGQRWRLSTILTRWGEWPGMTVDITALAPLAPVTILARLLRGWWSSRSRRAAAGSQHQHIHSLSAHVPLPLQQHLSPSNPDHSWGIVTPMFRFQWREVMRGRGGQSGVRRWQAGSWHGKDLARRKKWLSIGQQLLNMSEIWSFNVLKKESNLWFKVLPFAVSLK